ncbi:ectoine hydrolase DoeA [Varunaivibrio sulfuroxidans]|uniref:Ectoine hydrolase n=1 Tax=Varunaivibrio sulfuroxidans TaxID=1773489 RepID=A0A4R3J6R8_9PROT|nr:ectoine hydrolase DoeA [Varunaivibrio sulfuroxidans]TCS60546.1 ectoine hydrolase [Varunaivibrio sulfuroxidans]WES30036.1 ectoine hydrolase DoeA [Varunaivibrio sulfuroxidans]
MSGQSHDHPHETGDVKASGWFDPSQSQAPVLDFERGEYEDRVARTQREMARRGIELLVVTDPSNMCWLTGYDGWSFYVHQCVLVPVDDMPLWFGREMDVNGAKQTTYLPFGRLIGYDDRYVQSPDVHPMDHLADIIKGYGWGARVIALEMDNYYFSAKCYTSLRAHLPDARLEDAAALVNWRRLVKSPQEIAYMRKAARIVEAMHKRAFEIVAPGMTKKDLAAELTYSGIVGVDEEGGDYPAIVPLIATGREASAPHITWDSTKIKKGDVTFFEVAGCYKRYHCPMARSIFLGKPPQHILDAEKALLEASERAMEAARPGNRCEDIANAFFTTLRGLGFDKSSRCGYSTGLSYPPDWGERTISLRSGDTTELKPGMTLHFMPGLWYDDWGLEITETLLITEGAVECLANVERGLMVKD